MKKITWIAMAVACTFQISSAAVFAEDVKCGEDVDMADSLDFSKLHIDCDNDPDIVFDPEEGTKLFGKHTKAIDTYAAEESAGSEAAAPAQQLAYRESPKTSVPQQDLSSGKAAAAAVTGSAAQSALNQAEQAADNAGVAFNIREPFTTTGGPDSALKGLYVQMAHYCPNGWEKLKEWSVPNQSGYYLHYQFQCAK
ncbi:hypothetical protein [Pseudomaricurvus sp.]|uniref:hypothetical protein n=1 Tax=Pseudomaricurvus sp. TaxID=2004510 RepID=UPI003F6BDCD0